ncbi:heme-binding protein [Microdochium nivale]|nr:heme-binding protein [Microdochium nivale]
MHQTKTMHPWGFWGISRERGEAQASIPSSGQTNAPTPTTFPKPVNPAPPAPPNSAILELNLTEEELSFSKPLGSVPNRGLDKQGDIFINCVSYIQVVKDVTNTATGKADGNPIGIHMETGFFLAVPASTNNPEAEKTLVRMASIPHGTTINAQ